ncbi:MAG: ATP-dependent DNA helicase [Candidatus Heimdallarchaeota archaeon]|nr:MAG: ATP-dependent DNA helicase [Candidatus Heimdallarchaeota archaeon]
MTIRVKHEKKELQLSVRDISFFETPRSGKIQFSFKKAQQGQEIHRKIQVEKQRENTSYETEYFVKYKLSVQGWKVVIRGRIDLVVRSPNLIKIEEIKSVFLREFSGSPDDPRITPYRHQLQCYAWILKQLEPKLPPMRLQLILVNHYDTTQHDLAIPYIDMAEFVDKRLTKLIFTEEARQSHYNKKVRSLSNLNFPFQYRPYQKEIVQKIEEIIEKGLNIIIEAPSGLGKTVVSLYPLISRSIFEKSKLFFLTAKTTQRHIVERTLNLFQQQGVDFLSVTLKAKEKMCTNDLYFCHEEYCPFLKNYSHHFPEEFIEKFVRQRGIITPESIEREALNTTSFCPFELALDISLEADVIIGDYNYVFHPRVSLQRFFGEPRKLLFYLVIDEAHNLVNRSLAYYSHSLTRAEVIDLKRSLRQLRKKVRGIPLPEFLPPALERIFRSFRTEYTTEISTHLLREIDLQTYQSLLSRFEEDVTEYVQFLVKKDLHWPDDPVISFYYHFRDFVETLGLARNAEEFSILYNSHEGKVKILCKDASPFLEQQLKFFKSTIAISATITPFPFYRNMLGFPVDKTVYECFASPFSPDNRKILVIPEIDTRFKQRRHYYKEIAILIESTLEIKKGRYFVFFPSFQFAEKVASFITPQPDLLILKQTNQMHESDRQDFIHTIETSPHVVALAVASGIFAEGIDFPGVLDGIIVVGPNLPTVSFERELLQRYYDERFSDGFGYAYKFPGLTRSFQAAGRLIRTPTDRGIIMFIGHRYTLPQYSSYFPSYYYEKSPTELITPNPIQEIKLFWKKINPTPR